MAVVTSFLSLYGLLACPRKSRRGCHWQVRMRGFGLRSRFGRSRLPMEQQSRVKQDGIVSLLDVDPFVNLIAGG